MADIRYKVQEKVNGRWVDIYKDPEHAGCLFDTKGMAEIWIKWVHSESQDDMQNYRVVAVISRTKEVVQEALFGVAMAALGLFGFWLFLILLFSIE
jgi:hypothetical protein